jgi:hypothetical protein
MQGQVILTVTRDGESAILELYEGDNVALNDRFSDIQTFEVVGGYSQSFRIPAVEKNQEFFGPIFNANYTGYDFTTRLDANLSVDTIPIAVGYIQIKRIYTKGNGWHELELVFYSSVPNLAGAIGDKKIKDLTDLPNLNHEMTHANVVTPPANTIWALIERGQKFTEAEYNSTVRPIMSVDAPLYVADLTPHVNALYLFEQIFADAGFTFNSDFINNQLVKYWMPFCNNRYVLTEEGTNQAFYLDYEDGLDITLAPAAIKVNNDLTEFYDNGGNVNATSVFTAPFTGQFNFRTFLKARVTVGSLNSEYLGVRIVDTSNSNILHSNVFQIYHSVSGTNWFNYSDDFSLNLLEGQTIQMNFVNLGLTGLNATYNFDRGTGWQLINTSEAWQGGNVNMPLNAPDYKQIDFIRDILKMHNLVFIPSKTSPLQLDIEPFNTFLGSGGTIDWTDKLDLTNDVTIYPTTDEQKRNLLYTYAAGGEYLSDLFVKQGNRIYGNYLIDNTANDFAQGDNTVQLELRSTPCNEIPNTPVVVPKFIDQTGTFVLPFARLLFNAGETSVALWNEVTPAAEFTDIQLVNHYSEVNATLESEDLNFAPETPLQNITAIPFNTLFNSYWRRYYNELYSDQSRIMEAFFQLDINDFMNIDYSKQIWIKDSYWRLIQVDNFVVGMDISTKCTLAKIVSSVQDCTYTPVAVGENGVVIFEDANGDESDGSQACCERYGYNWTGSVCSAFVGTGRPNLNGQGTPTPVIDFSVAGFNRSAVAVGQDMTVIQRGVHIGQATNITGRAQGGTIVLSGTGNYSASGDKIVISDQGADVFLPSQSVWSCALFVVINQYDTGTNVISKVHAAQFNFTLIKKNATAQYSTPVIVYSDGDLNTVDVSIDVVTDTSLHKIRIGSTGGSGYPFNNCRITATMTYAQSRL